MTESIPQLQKTICDLTNVLSLIMKRAPDFEKEDDDQSTSQCPHSLEQDNDLEDKADHLDEADFEDAIATGDRATGYIKQNFLDRLAEVLARFKTAKGSVPTKGNSDAKHVASVIMLEDVKGRSATFICAKNEGLDDVDLKFLKKLESLLRNIKNNGKPSPSLLLAHRVTVTEQSMS